MLCLLPNSVVSTSKRRLVFAGKESLNGKTSCLYSPFFFYQDIKKPKSITCALFTSKGDLITGDSQGTILLWNVSTKKIERVINNAHASSITSLCITCNGILLTTARRDTFIKSWNHELKNTGSNFNVSRIQVYTYWSYKCSFLNSSTFH